MPTQQSSVHAVRSAPRGVTLWCQCRPTCVSVSSHERLNCVPQASHALHRSRVRARCVSATAVLCRPDAGSPPRPCSIWPAGSRLGGMQQHIGRVSPDRGIQSAKAVTRCNLRRLCLRSSVPSAPSQTHRRAQTHTTHRGAEATNHVSCCRTVDELVRRGGEPTWAVPVPDPGASQDPSRAVPLPKTETLNQTGQFQSSGPSSRPGCRRGGAGASLAPTCGRQRMHRARRTSHKYRMSVQARPKAGPTVCRTLLALIYDSPARSLGRLGTPPHMLKGTKDAESTKGCRTLASRACLHGRLQLETATQTLASRHTAEEQCTGGASIGRPALSPSAVSRGRPKRRPCGQRSHLGVSSRKLRRGWPSRVAGW